MNSVEDEINEYISDRINRLSCVLVICRNGLMKTGTLAHEMSRHIPTLTRIVRDFSIPDTLDDFSICIYHSLHNS